MKRKTKMAKRGRRKIKPDLFGTIAQKIEYQIQHPDALIFSDKGIPILELNRKIKALQTSLLNSWDEDSLGHLFDLINFVAPNYNYSGLKGIQALKNHFGHATPVYHKVLCSV